MQLSEDGTHRTAYPLQDGAHYGNKGIVWSSVSCIAMFCLPVYVCVYVYMYAKHQLSIMLEPLSQYRHLLHDTNLLSRLFTPVTESGIAFAILYVLVIPRR